jgi:hypothetical protein
MAASMIVHLSMANPTLRFRKQQAVRKTAEKSMRITYNLNSRSDVTISKTKS